MAKRKTALALRLIRLRRKHKLSQAAAAEQIGVTTRAWISWENDQRRPGRLATNLLRSAFPDF